MREGVHVQRCSTREFSCGDVMVFYLDCGCSYTNLALGLKCIELYLHPHTQVNAESKMVKTEEDL